MLEIKCGILGNFVSTPTLASVQHRAVTTQQDYRAVTSHAGLAITLSARTYVTSTFYISSVSVSINPTFVQETRKQSDSHW